MQVTVSAATKRPMEVISKAAGMCYGKSDYSAKRVKTCCQSGHMSVFEHASVTFEVDGISRACSHQLVRHRIGVAFSQRSHRYCKVDVDSDDWYVVPNWFEDGWVNNCSMRQAFESSMENAAIDYQNAIESGCKPEDARYLLPEATKTAITVTMNARELFHFLDVRQDSRAQWEIRELANEMERAARDFNGQWAELMAIREEARE